MVSSCIQHFHFSNFRENFCEMACYAALLSLFHTLNNIKIHPRPPIYLDQSQVESLNRNLDFLLEFLESYPNSDSQEDDDLESHIAAAAYAAEDLIETHIVDRIDRARSTSDHGEKICPVDLYGGLERVIQDMDLIRKQVMQIKKHKDIGAQHHDHLPTNSSVSTASTWQSSSTPEFDDAMVTQVLDKLAGQQSSLQIIPIVGMGGIGKTTFATTLYTKPLIEQHFQIRAWVTISQEYSIRNILVVLCQEFKVSPSGLSEDKKGFSDLIENEKGFSDLSEDKKGFSDLSEDEIGFSGLSEDKKGFSDLSEDKKGFSDLSEDKKGFSDLSEDEIGLKLYKHLYDRKYLIVMDDIWSVEAWDKVRTFFPDNNNGSRIMTTTRLSNLAFELSGCHVVQMKFLDEDKSWDLFCEVVFGKLDCPIELKVIGKEIAKKCRGLPLSIAVIGGLLRKSNMTRAYWIYTLENLNSLISLENDEYTLRILNTSYKELPMHLKPCFLYMGIFPEDVEIRMSELIRLWVAEGILRQIDDKSLEEVGKEYLKELMDRNLILMGELHLRWDGKAKFCKIHDLLRDLSLREAQKQKFFWLLNEQKDHTPRSLFYRLNGQLGEWLTDPPSLRFRLLRVFSPIDKFNMIFTDSEIAEGILDCNAIFEQANMRYFSLLLSKFDAAAAPRLLALCSLVWNLQTLEVSGLDYPEMPIIASKIWEMPLLRHVMLADSFLPDPPNGEHNYVLENLHTLSGIMNLKFSEEVVRRIPNIKKLKLRYYFVERYLPDFCLHNLGRLQKLESLSIQFPLAFKLRRNLANFPHSLKKLCLYRTKISWEELTIRIGSLPLLQFLKLNWDACVGPKWKTKEGQFCSLRVLQIEKCYDLKYWETDNSNFPRLEHLFLSGLTELEEIPSSIEDIQTLKSIRLERCSRSAEDSARKIKEYQEECENVGLQIEIRKTKSFFL